jgi:hypothetical protein
MLATDGTQMLFDITSLREAIKLDKAAKTLSIDTSPALAWKIVDVGYDANKAISVCSVRRSAYVGADARHLDRLDRLPRA